MPKAFHEKLIARLKTDARFVDNAGELIVAAVKDCAWHLDAKLLTLLMDDKEIEAQFFDEINGRWVFNYNAFITYISDKNFLANAYTRFRNKIGLNINEKFLPERGEVALVWPYKDCVLEGGQTREQEKRTEVFFNELLAPDEINRLLAPKVLTKWKRHTRTGEQPVQTLKRNDDGTMRENLLIKGNNLLALHSLKLQFRGKVKCVYIDPPYNTGGAADSFTYNNTFNHSTWLTFMRNRLEVAKELLREDGMITVAINDAELFYLGVLLDEVFGRENKIGVLCIRHHPRGTTQSRFFSTVHEYALIYAKDAKRIQEDFRFETTDEIEEESFVRAREDATPDKRPSLYYPIFYNPTTQEITLKAGGEDFVKLLPMGKNGMRTWKLIKASFLAELNDGKIYVRKVGREYRIYRKIVRKKNKAKTMWTDARYDANHHGTGLLKKMFEGRNLFSYPKSLYTVMDILKLTTDAGDIIVDFFAGSGTTGHAVIELNRREGGVERQFILVEQLEEHVAVCKERLEKVLAQEPLDNATFLSCELMPYNAAFVERIQTAQSTEELVQIWREMAKESFLNWYINAEMPEEAINDFIAIGDVVQQQSLLVALLDKNQLYVNLSEMEDADFQVTDEDKVLNREFYRDEKNLGI